LQTAALVLLLAPLGRGPVILLKRLMRAEGKDVGEMERLSYLKKRYIIERYLVSKWSRRCE
jgi:hypothetical protein